MNGRVVKPFSTAFFANIPDWSITLGLEVLVQLVMAAITIEPCFKSYSFPSKVIVFESFRFSSAILNPLNPTGDDKQASKSYFIDETSTLSCGLFGPEMHGTTVDISSSITSPEKSGFS